MVVNKSSTDRQQNPPMFSCKDCLYVTNNKNDFLKHKMTLKHKRSTALTNSSTKSTKKSQDCELPNKNPPITDTEQKNEINNLFCEKKKEKFIAKKSQDHDLSLEENRKTNKHHNIAKTREKRTKNSAQIVAEKSQDHDLSLEENRKTNRDYNSVSFVEIAKLISHDKKSQDHDLSLSENPNTNGDHNNSQYEENTLSHQHLQKSQDHEYDTCETDDSDVTIHDANDFETGDINIASFFSKNVCDCGKRYKERSGLWRHSKKCKSIMTAHESQNEVIYKTTADNKLVVDNNLTHAIIELLKQNQEFKELMIEQNKQMQEQHMKQSQELQSQIFEFAKEGRNTVINNLNTTNNSFNLHVYLNETCKDAINLLDYVNSLNLSLADLEATGKLGYTNGMSRIFINGLKDMDVHLRPIHCSDLKREVLYIKEDNVWEKDNENRDKLKGALRMIEKKNIMQIPLWIKAHPNCVISSNRENTPYLKMVMQSTGGENPAETADMAKIITNIARAVVINK
jgi:hypothetical protein